MLTPQTKVSPDPDVIYTDLGNGESVLLHLGTSQYFSLNETGSIIWQGIIDDLSLGDIGSRLVAKYTVVPEKAQGSVINLVDALIAEHLVTLISE